MTRGKRAPEAEELLRRGRKQCQECKKEKDISQFYNDKSRWDGLHGSCRSCKRKRPYKASDPHTNYCRHIKRTYGLTIEDIAELHDVQRYRCGICGSKDSGTKQGGFHIDHNHITQKVRGLLCHQCNLMLGNAKDNVEILQAAMEYLNDNQES